MRKFFITALLVPIALSVSAQKEIKADQAKDNIGEMVKICTRIELAFYEENGSLTRLFNVADTSNPPITFIISAEKRKNFNYKPEKDLKEREVCITGKIELLKDRPVLTIEKQGQIQIK